MYVYVLRGLNSAEENMMPPYIFQVSNWSQNSVLTILVSTICPLFSYFFLRLSQRTAASGRRSEQAR